MAVINAFKDANVAAGKKGIPAIVSGGKVLVLAGTFEMAAADDNGSIYKIGKLPSNAIPVRADIINDATAGATDVDLGLYRENGVVADKDILLDGGDLSAGHAITAPLDGLTNLGGADPIAAVGKKLWELLGLSLETKDSAYDLALTAN